MKYSDATGDIDTPRKILKVNHAGEFGAINIYRAQLLVCRLFMPSHVPMLQHFLSDETRHLGVFLDEIQSRRGVKCKSYWLCGIGGYAMGFVSALLGTRGIMACTWAVESVVAAHLQSQLAYLAAKGDRAAYEAVMSILDDEVNQRDTGFALGGSSNRLYAPIRFMIATFTEGVIRFGMR